MENIDQKPLLNSYELVSSLPLFFSDIEIIAADYDFVAVAEKRNYNLFFVCNPQLEKLVSFQGLLTQSRVLAAYYEVHHSFPKLLLVDDMLIHGRTMRKYIDRLENAILFYLRKNGMDDKFEEARFRRDLLDAISIHVYAKTIGTILMEDRFLAKISSYKKASFSELRDLSIQLSDMLVRWNIPNADFSPSIWLNEENLKQTPNGWQRTQWEYEKEEMIVYYRVNDEQNARWLSTLRVFPMRKEKGRVPAICYSMINGFRQDNEDDLCREISEILKHWENEKQNTFGQVRELLESNNVYLAGSKREFVNYLLSLADLCSFVQSLDAKEPIDYIQNSDFDSDYRKIALNFGTDHVLEVGRRKITEEFEQFLQNKKLRSEICEAVLHFFAVNGESMRDISWLKENHEEPESEEFDIVNQRVLFYFSEWGMELEKQAYRYANKPYLFSSSTFQEYYSIGNQSKEKIVHTKNGDDGAALFSIEDTLRELQHTGDISSIDSGIKYPLSSYLASYLYMIDIGILGNRGYLTIDKHIVTLIRTGETSTYCFPKLIAAFIPAFSYIESRFSYLDSNKRLAIAEFWDSIKKIPLDTLEREAIPEECDQEEKETLLKDLQRIKALWPAKDKLMQNISRLYAVGQSFSGWYFDNICHPDYEINFGLQDYFKDEAIAFMNDWVSL